MSEALQISRTSGLLMLLCLVLSCSSRYQNPPALPQDSVASTNVPGPNLVFSGCIKGDEGLKALIQNPEQGIGSFKEVGQDAFGYTVREINPAWVLLERDGKTWRLPLRENK